jgi:hypothetical protein
MAEERRWSEEWTLGSDTNPRVTTATVALTGPEVYHEQTVEVVPKIEAEQRRIERDDALARAEKAEAQLAECYRLTGSDPDGDSDSMLAREAVQAVRELRGENERVGEWEDRAVRAEAQLATLRAEASRLLGALRGEVEWIHDCAAWEPPSVVARRFEDIVDRCADSDQHLTDGSAQPDALSVGDQLQPAQTKAELVAERNYLLRWLGGFSAELTGLSADAMTLFAYHGGKPANYPRDTDDLGRCERAYAAAPPHLQARMLPLLEKWRNALADQQGGGEAK